VTCSSQPGNRFDGWQFRGARKGTDVYGRLAEAKEAGHFSGSSELQLELTRHRDDGRDYPVVSSDYTLQARARLEHCEESGRWRCGGAIIGRCRGGKGAAIGAGVGSAAGAGVQGVDQSQQVKVPSETLLEFRSTAAT